jgi:hypothetical protein
MKLSWFRPTLLSCLLLLLSGMAFADNATVDCSGATPGAFMSLQQAILSLPPAGPNTIVVSGTCVENIAVVGYTGLSVFGNPSASIQAADPTNSVLIISQSQRISFLNNITFSGGQGIAIVISTPVRFDHITVQNSGSLGITSVDSLVHFSNSSVTGSTRSGISATGGSFYVDGGVNVSNNGRLGISAGTGHLTLGHGSVPGTANIISHNGIGGVQIVSTAAGDFSGDNQITSNGGQFAVLVLNGSNLTMTDGAITGNTGLGVHCGGTSHCEFGGNTLIQNNGAGGIEVVEHSDASLVGGLIISGNTGNGVLVDQGSSLTSLGGNTISNNTNDGLVLNTLSALKFVANDTITATPGNLALNCNNGSMVEGDVSTYKPKKCGIAFQNNPIH